MTRIAEGDPMPGEARKIPFTAAQRATIRATALLMLAVGAIMLFTSVVKIIALLPMIELLGLMPLIFGVQWLDALIELAFAVCPVRRRPGAALGRPRRHRRRAPARAAGAVRGLRDQGGAAAARRRRRDLRDRRRPPAEVARSPAAALTRPPVELDLLPGAPRSRRPCSRRRPSVGAWH
jgi:hypothetical protein